MSVESDLYTILATAGTVYAVQAPQGAAEPRITYRKVVAVRAPTLTESAGIARTRFQIDCWASDYKAALDLGNAARAALNSSTLKITMINDNPQDFEEDTKLYRESFDIAVWQ